MKKNLLLATAAVLLLSNSVMAEETSQKVLYSQDFSEGVGDNWYGKYLTKNLVEGDETYGSYVTLGTKDNSRSYYSYMLFYSDTENGIYTDVTKYSIEFDAFFGQVTFYTETNELGLFGEGFTAPSSPRYGDVSDLLEGDYIFDFEGGGSTTKYSINENYDQDSIDIESEAWYHFKVDVDMDASSANYTINKVGESTTITGSLTDIGSTKCQGIFFRSARNNGYIGIDNIVVYADAAAGINDIKTSVSNNGATYTLSGVKTNATDKGVYIRNGKKFIVR